MMSRGFMHGRINQTGQIMPLAMLTLIPFVLLIAMLFNTGEHVVRKMKVQNAADAAAMTQATWTARSLNLIAMNNVAITQSFVINVVGSAILPVLQEAVVLAAAELADIAKIGVRCAKDTASCVSSASGSGPAYPVVLAACLALKNLPPDGACAKFGLRTEHFLSEIKPKLERMATDLGIPGNILTQGPKMLTIYAAGAPKIKEFGEIAESLAAMNKKIVAEFPEFTQTLAKDLAQENGLDDPPRFYSAYKALDDKGLEISQNSKYLTTGLPVVPNEFDADGVAKAALGFAPVKFTGEKGTPRKTRIAGQHWNFQEHGYKIAKGPYPVAIKNPSKELKKLKEALGEKSLSFLRYTGPKKKVTLKFDDIVEKCWQISANVQVIPGGNCLIPINLAAITIYEIDQDFLATIGSGAGAGNILADPDDISLLAFTRSARTGGAVATDRFDNPPNAVFGYAQAEIYNDVYPDLYTQDWRAKLRPATLLEKDRERRTAAIKATVDFAALNRVFSRLSKDDHRRLNAH